MTAAHTEPGRIGAPELCRVTVLARHTQVDLALPADVPVALLVPGVVDLITAHRSHNDFDTSSERVEPETWALARLGSSRLAAALSLHEHGVRDGDLLVLEHASAPAPPPLFDDVTHSVATADEAGAGRWSPRAAATVAAGVALSATVVGAGALLRLSSPDGRLAAGAGCAALAALLLLAGILLGRTRHDHRTATILCACAVPAAFATGVLVVPGSFGPAHPMLGAVLSGAVATLVLLLTAVGRVPFTAVAAVAATAAAAFLVAAATGISGSAVGAGVVVTALLTVTFAPRLAMKFADLPLPPVPGPGTGAPAPQTEGGRDEPDSPDGGDRSLPDPSELAAAAARTRDHLTGLIGAGAVLAVAGAWCAAAPLSGDGLRRPGTALAVAAAAVIMLRGRTYTDARQATLLVAGGATVPVGLLVAAAVGGSAPPVVVFALALAVATAALVFGVVAPRRVFTPVQRRAAEVVEYAVIATIVPLACWVTGLYAAVRGF
ncbi:type VII secretion integral membrane protein EccD [Rhodococcus sp. 14C212]|uniref:type VII secretion integral membrane protein EccD n=1 Tax=Rhodococcus sp. 14C212 TaxID=2711209 RepID=UPI0013EB3ABA|nr:type VII secretion integral membrane protein EccD [Rhodococcus sp. 14C212]NGP06097.1 type VII secretion integral membrane protein EccD [Rhodococcus sp. 14C212]